MVVSIRALSLSCANLLALIAPAAFAANLVPDPDFNAGSVSSWPSAGSSTSISFDGTQNIVGTVGSGSALLTNGNANYNANSSLCLPGSYAAGVWQYGGWLRVGAGQFNGLASARIGLVFYTTNDCSTGNIAGGITASPASTGTWVLLVNTLTLPSAANSVLIYLNNRTNATPPLSINYDGIRFGPQGTTPVTLQSFDVR